MRGEGGRSGCRNGNERERHCYVRIQYDAVSLQCQSQQTA